MAATAPRTLLLSHGTAELRNAGEIFLRTLAAHYPADRLCRFMYVPRGDPRVEGAWLGFPVSGTPVPRQRTYRRFGETVGSWVSHGVWEYLRLVSDPALARRAVEFGRAQGVEQVWAVLNSPYVIHTARRVADELQVPLVVMVWDPPERIAAALEAHPRTLAAMCDEFDQVIRRAARVGVASDGMRDEYRRRYGVDSIVLIQGVDAAWIRPPADGFVDPRRLVIGFAGSMYAAGEFDALIAALSSSDWRVADRDVTVRVLGRSLAFESTEGVRIEWLGWHSVTDVIELLAQVDLCYVPYWMDEVHHLAARLCFPNKIAIYLAAGRPLFVHAAADASPSVFVAKHGAGICCDSDQPAEIIGSLAGIVGDPAGYARMARAGTSVASTEFSLSVFVERFAQLTGAPAEELSPAGSVEVAGLV